MQERQRSLLCCLFEHLAEEYLHTFLLFNNNNDDDDDTLHTYTQDTHTIITPNNHNTSNFNVAAVVHIYAHDDDPRSCKIYY